MKYEKFTLGARNRLRLFFIGQIEPSPTCYNKNTIQTLIKIAIRHRRLKKTSCSQSAQSRTVEERSKQKPFLAPV